MPKQKITKEMVVDAAFEIARNRGMEHVLVKDLADKIGCSVQPIYCYCKNMEGLRREVIQKTIRFIQDYMTHHIDKDHFFSGVGRSYLRLAKEEPHLFQIFVLHQREGITSFDDLYETEATPHIAKLIAEQLHITIETAKQLHLNMLIYTIGIGTILAVTSPGIPLEDVYHQQEQAYQIFLRDTRSTNENKQKGETI